MVVQQTELLVARDDANHPFGWGSYPMVPWAGRVRRGRFHFDDAPYELAIDFAPHSIHGVAFDTPWTVVESTDTSATLQLDLAMVAKSWPFGGIARQHLRLDPFQLTQTLEVTAGARPMPASLGWHPWFRRNIGAGASLELDVDLRQARQYARDEEHIPSGQLIRPQSRPWDDTFIGVREVTLRWPGALSLRIDHDCSHMVIFDPDHAICVEPQTGPPDAFTLEPGASRLAAGATLRATTSWSWTSDSSLSGRK